MTNKKGFYSARDKELIQILVSNKVSKENIAKLLNRTNRNTIVSWANRNNIFYKDETKKYNRELRDINNENKKIFFNKNFKNYGIQSRFVGFYSENIVAIKLASLGFKVFKPNSEASKADLLILKENKFSKIQVKTARYEESTNYFSAEVRIRKIINNKSVSINYDKSEIDFVIIKLNGFQIFYIYPIEHFKNFFNLFLTPHRDKPFFKTRKKKDNYDENYFMNNFDLLTA